MKGGHMTDLPTINSNVSFDQIAEVIGQDAPSAPTLGHTILKINRDIEDDDGKSIPPGSWMTTHTGRTIYAKKASFQVFLQRYQYLQYDPKINELVNKSILAKNLYPQTEIPDMLGTMRCGSVSASKRDTLTADQVYKQQQISCFRMLWGKVFFEDAVNSDGESVEVGGLPVVWRAKGANFMPISDVLDSLSAQKKPFLFYKLSADLQKQKKGSNVYYVANFSVSGAPVEFSQEDQELLSYFVDYVASENSYIMGEYDKCLKSSDKVIDGSVTVDDLDDDLSAVI
jgi:hypothetical protein